MTRISRDEMLMRMAVLASSRGTCSRAKVGALITHDGRVLSTGYNGAPAGLPHCNHLCNCSERLPPGQVHGEFAPDPDCRAVVGCKVSSHAEANAIAYAARYGVRTERSELFCTHLPCPVCARLIINCGITRVVYGTDYRLKDGRNLLRSAGVLIEHLPCDMMTP